MPIVLWQQVCRWCTSVGQVGSGTILFNLHLFGAGETLSCDCLPIVLTDCFVATGLQTMHLYWPGRIRYLCKTVLFNLHQFDAGETLFCGCLRIVFADCFVATGLQTTHLYWPGRIRHLGKTVLFNLHLFDAGETALKRYDHILPVSWWFCLHFIYLITCITTLVANSDRTYCENVPGMQARNYANRLAKQ